GTYNPIECGGRDRRTSGGLLATALTPWRVLGDQWVLFWMFQRIHIEINIQIRPMEMMAKEKLDVRDLCYRGILWGERGLTQGSNIRHYLGHTNLLPDFVQRMHYLASSLMLENPRGNKNP